ncbi:glycogen debranching N-terminal domain-containing protein [Brevundimonas sp.]|uniref:glycogen debranching N-terminal domain-containing protein n=1 Tax=Brevundimonas sp. TaxID=1871086 RepID=UPI00286CE678|nr:glycogen debranching N-terminal domain-containing protein [Brevundimonas sp.]
MAHVVKENRTYLVADTEGAIGAGLHGVFRDDTRMLSTWRWTIDQAQTLSVQTHEDALLAYHAIINTRRVQVVGLTRRMTLRDDGLDDAWVIVNTGDSPQLVTLTLDVVGEFRDLFTIFRPVDSDGDRTVSTLEEKGRLRLARVTSDGLTLGADITFTCQGGTRLCQEPRWSFELQPGSTATLTATVRFTDGGNGQSHALPSYQDWRSSFRLTPPDKDKARSVARAIDDLRALLLGTANGPYPAAGLPWFSCIFGRDALITASMILPWRPDLARSVLRLLASEQGRTDDPFREEEPGKILHEIRLGEISRRGIIPFGRYYGSVDSTALFVTTLDAHAAATGDESLIVELRPNWEAALDWLGRQRAEGGQLITFAPSGSGLAVQSWKDSPDSMNHADGTPAEAPLAVAEVQGYAIAAFRAAAGFYARLGEPELAETWAVRAQGLAEEFHERFWLEPMGTYAMALDRHGRPLEVLSSDPGHLLWSGAVPAESAPRLVQTLMGDALWNGWGLRTLGAGEATYNPVSYHNGSVWPHDTAILAGGLARYGFDQEARRVAEALFDLAASQPMNRLPELISGFARTPGLDPIPYTHACRPQAWAAAGLLYAARTSGLA